MTHSEAAPEGAAQRLLRRFLDVRPAEVAALCWAWLFVFAILSSYYVLRPIRDEMGVQGGVRNLAWLFSGTLIAMIVVNPVFAAMVRRFPRARFIAITYRFFMANLVLFGVVLAVATPDQDVWVGRVFFIWVSVFNLFVVSVFWAFIVDVFDAEQGRRLFGFLAAGATIGAIVGSSVTSGLAAHLPTYVLLAFSIVLLEVAVFAMRRLSAIGTALHAVPGQKTAAHAVIGGGIFAGFAHVFRSPYLMGIGGIIVLYTVTSTFLYFLQASAAATYFETRAERTAFFANIDLAVNVLTLVAQIFITGRMLKTAGVAITLSALPVFSLIGFGVLAAAPGLIVLVVVQVLRRVGNFAFAKPARELLFTVVSREDKYKSKNVLDTVVYRAGDQIGSWSYTALGALGLGMAGISLVAVPLAALWIGLSFWLGTVQQARAGGGVRAAAE